MWRARVAGHMVGQLFLRSYERSDRVYAAMLSRGYRGQPMLLHSETLRAADWAIVAGVGFVLLMLQVVGRVPLL
jgi:cobalt/nickel transport system permease protein